MPGKLSRPADVRVKNSRWKKMSEGRQRFEIVMQQRRAAEALKQTSTK